jgi:RsiW-degrading membrane proteinase PrsW (M82 family)
MGQLANANLLDDSVANSSSLKNQRLNKTAQKAINPKPRVEYREEVATKEVEQEEVEIDDDFDNEYEETQNQPPRFAKTSFSNSNKIEQENDDKKEDNKILGMKPALFYGILAVGAVVGGYFLYKKFFKNKTINAQTPTPIPSVDVVVPTPTTNIGNG